MIEVKFKKLNDFAKMPTQAYKGDACFDFYSVNQASISGNEFREVSLGIAIELPEGYEMAFRTRSSFGRKGVQIHPGTIDTGYRGYLSVFVFNHSKKMLEISIGDKIAQGAVRPILEVNFVEVEELAESERGEKGFGSSGK